MQNSLSLSLSSQPQSATATHWTPADFVGLIAWFRADNVTTGGGTVSAWGDLSGNGHHATAPTSGNEGVLTTIGSRAAVTFDGATTGYLTNNVPATTTTIFVVLQSDVTANTRYIFQYGTTNYGQYLLTKDTGFSYVARLGIESVYNANSASWLTTGTPVYLRQEFNSTHASHKVFLNGAQVAATTSISHDAASAVNDTFSFGVNRGFSSLFFSGKIAELIVCPYLGPSDVALFEGYLSWYYSI